MLRTPNRQNALDGAVALISLVDLFLIINLFIIYTKFFCDVKCVSKNLFMVLGLSIAFILYLSNTVYFKRRIAQIKELFDKESNTQKWIGRIIVLIIGVGSVGSIIAIGLLLK